MKCARGFVGQCCRVRLMPNRSCGRSGCAAKFRPVQIFELDSRQRFVGAFGHRRERPIQRLGSVDDHSGSLAWIRHGRIDEAAPHDVLNDRNLPIGLNPCGERPQNFRGVVDVDVVVEDKNVFCPVPSQRCRRGTAGIAFRHFFHRDENIEQGVPAAGTNGLDAGHRSRQRRRYAPSRARSIQGLSPSGVRIDVCSAPRRRVMARTS